MNSDIMINRALSAGEFGAISALVGLVSAFVFLKIFRAKTPHEHKLFLPIMACAMLLMYILRAYFSSPEGAKFVQYFSDPAQCTTVKETNKFQEYCLDEKFRPPLDCFFDKEKFESKECIALISLSNRNRAPLEFNVFGRTIKIEKEVGSAN